MPRDEQRHQLVAQLLVGHRRAVLVARLEQHRQHVVALAVARRGARRSARRSARRPARGGRRSAANGPTRSEPLHRAEPAAASRLIGLSPNASIVCSRSRSASRRAPGSSPKTARRMISSVRRLHARVQLELGPVRPARRPRARPPRSSARAAAPCARRGRRAASACAARGGRPRRAGSPSCAPTTGSSTRAPSPGCSTSGGAVKTCLTSSGSDSITNGGASGRRSVKRLP